MSARLGPRVSAEPQGRQSRVLLSVTGQLRPSLCVSPPPQSLPPLLLVKLIQERLGEDDCLRRVSALRGSRTRAREGEGRVSTPVLRRR